MKRETPPRLQCVPVARGKVCYYILFSFACDVALMQKMHLTGWVSLSLGCFRTHCDKLLLPHQTCQPLSAGNDALLILRRLHASAKHTSTRQYPETKPNLCCTGNRNRQQVLCRQLCLCEYGLFMWLLQSHQFRQVSLGTQEKLGSGFLLATSH